MIIRGKGLRHGSPLAAVAARELRAQLWTGREQRVLDARVIAWSYAAMFRAVATATMPVAVADVDASGDSHRRW